MKCDELKAKRHIDEDTGIVFSFYVKSEVDAAIAELMQKLEDAEMRADLAECAVTEYKIDYDKLKSEADKVIADLEKKLDLYKRGFKEDDKINAYLYAELRHQKFERCIDKANYWVAISYHCVDDKHRQRAERHHRKWLEIAKQFKEAK